MKATTPHLEPELIILGAGCAGLSVASLLLEKNPELALVIVDPRTEYIEDRTWCGWRVEPHFFSDCVAAEWNDWRIIHQKRQLHLQSSRYPYEMLRSNLVYDKACKLIQSGTRTRFLKGCSAHTVIEDFTGVNVAFSNGETLRSPFVIDTRPQTRTLSAPWLWQNFVGYVVELESSYDWLSSSPVLMEFQTPQESVARFLYTLPLSKNQFLFEFTRFSKVYGELESIEAELQQWIRDRFGGKWILKRKESGSLPMAPHLPSSQRRVIFAGTRGGSMRISTGYAFHRIQRWARDCSESFLLSGVPLPPKSNPMLNMMDELFLRVLNHPTTSVADLFTDLFHSCPPDILVRFLSGVPHSTDLWPVVHGLPWGKFIKEIPKLRGSRDLSSIKQIKSDELPK